MKNWQKNLFFLSALNLFLPVFTWAFCPVCTVAAGAGVGLARWLKIDDTITGLWIGALLLSASMWTIDWLKIKKFNFPGSELLVFLLYYGLTIGPFFYAGIIGHPFNTFWGMDKLLLGIITGTIVFFFAGQWYQKIKKKNGGHAQFAFQKVVLPIGLIAILSAVFFVLTKYFY